MTLQRPAIFREASHSPVESNSFTYSDDTDSSCGGIETWISDQRASPEILWEDQSMKLFRFRQSRTDSASKSAPKSSMSYPSTKTSMSREKYRRQNPLSSRNSDGNREHRGKPSKPLSPSKTLCCTHSLSTSQSVSSRSVSSELAATWLQMGENRQSFASGSVGETTASSSPSTGSSQSHVRQSDLHVALDHRQPKQKMLPRVPVPFWEDGTRPTRGGGSTSLAVSDNRRLIRDRDDSEDDVSRGSRSSHFQPKMEPNKNKTAGSSFRGTGQGPHCNNNTNNSQGRSSFTENNNKKKESAVAAREPTEKAFSHIPKPSRPSPSNVQEPRSVFRVHSRDPPGRGSASTVRHTINNFHSSGTIMTAAKSLWRTATDPASGRTYYYHVETRETQWRKPVELASDQEKEEMRKKEEQQRNFFAAMEANILKNLQTGAMVESTQVVEEREKTSNFLQTRSVDSTDGGLERPGLVRTISTMDRQVLSELVKRQPSNHNLFGNSPTEVIAGKFAGTATREDVLTDQTKTLSLADYSQEFGQEKGRNESEGSLQREGSLGTILSGLPTDPNASSRMGNSYLSGVGDSFYDKSAGDFGMSEDEFEALEQLAEISDQMSSLAVEGEDMMPEETRDRSRFSLSTRRLSVARASMRSIDLDLIKEDVSEHSEHSAKGDAVEAERNKALERMSDNAGAPEGLERPAMARRNTCGTIYVGSTMSAPDKDATIKCICGVFRAHILQSERENSVSTNEYLVFNDLESQQKPSSALMKKIDAPTLEDITMFYRDVFRRSQLETDCIIMSLIYVERLIRRTDGRLRPRSTNWRSVLFSCMILASKVWDDLSMWNADFSQTCPAGVKFSLQRINELEIEVLSALSYDVKVPASEYAKYYFLLRSMLIKSGLGSEDLEAMNPLDVQGAMKLQQMTARYQASQSPTRPGLMTRSKSVANGGKGELKASLEHMVQM
mmetsp:Transcript_23600/g.44898  ORF Transcript_23600/g.44898 Transcript_23600/m.44898 type:complete len:954 (-) Transcript_23600:56-2917(-)